MTARSVDILTWNVPIVDNNGLPTPEFQRKWAQQHAVNDTIPPFTSITVGNLSPLFTSAVTVSANVANITFTLDTAGAKTIFGNASGSTAAPSFGAATGYSDAVLNLSTTGLVKRTGANTYAIGVAKTDYAPPTSGSSILYGDGSGGFSNVTVGSGLTFSGGTLAADGSTTPIYAPLVSGTSDTGLQLVGNPDNNLVLVQVGP